MALLNAAVGQSQALDGREAGSQAMRAALDKTARAPVAFGWVIASHALPLQQVLFGATDLLGNVPLLGFSTSGTLYASPEPGTAASMESDSARRSVVVALITSEDVQGRSGWWPDFGQDSRACTQNMLQAMQPDAETGDILLAVADGLSGDAAFLCQAVSSRNYLMAGCLAGGELWRGRTYQLGGRQSGGGGLAAAVLSGDIAIGVGAAHGWQPAGALARLTRVQGQWVRTLDDQPANEAYARLFGYSARQWAYPPLNDIVRLYPLGLQEGDSEDSAAEILVRSPLRMEADGSLRMNTTLPEGRLVNFMIGSQQGCLEAARRAAKQALATLGQVRPSLALLLVDAAWQTLFEVQPDSVVRAVQEILGEEMPMAGGYTFGQMARLPAMESERAGAKKQAGGNSSNNPARLLNQHILVLLFGSRGIEGDDIPIVRS
jgi:hypothetical protein